MPAISSTATRAVNGIVRGAAINVQLLASGSSSATFVTPSTTIATNAPAAPTTIPSITNGQRMNQSVAPTSFITSTSRRRANSDSLMVLAINSTEAAISSTVNTAAVIVTRLVTSRIFLVSSLWLETLWIDWSIVPQPPALSAVRIASASAGLSGYTWKVSGSGLVESSAYAAGSSLAC